MRVSMSRATHIQHGASSFHVPLLAHASYAIGWVMCHPAQTVARAARQVQNSATQRRVSQCMQASTAPLVIGAGDKCLHVGMTTCRDSHVTRHGLRNNPPRFGGRPVGSELCHPAARVAISPPILHTHPATHTVTTAREECPQVGMSTCCGSDVARHHARTHIARPCAVS